MGCGGSNQALDDSTQKEDPVPEKKYETLIEVAIEPTEENAPIVESPKNVVPWTEKSLIASGSIDHTARVWNMETGEVLLKILGHEGEGVCDQRRSRRLSHGCGPQP